MNMSDLKPLSFEQAQIYNDFTVKLREIGIKSDIHFFLRIATYAFYIEDSLEDEKYSEEISIAMCDFEKEYELELNGFLLMVGSFFDVYYDIERYEDLDKSECMWEERDVSAEVAAINLKWERRKVGDEVATEG